MTIRSIMKNGLFTLSLEVEGSNWIIKTNDIIELSKKEYDIYQEMWRVLLQPIVTPGHNVLIVGGGDQQVYRTINNIPCTVTIVDPYASSYTEEPFKSILNTTTFKHVYNQDTKTYKTLTLVDETFQDALQDDILKGGYNTIAVDCSDDFEDFDIGIYTPEFVKNCYRLLKPNGSLIIYMGIERETAKSKLFVNALEGHFACVDQVSKFIHSYDKHTKIMLYVKNLRNVHV